MNRCDQTLYGCIALIAKSDCRANSSHTLFSPSPASLPFLSHTVFSVLQKVIRLLQYVIPVWLTWCASAELENTAPRINSTFKPKHEDLIQAQKRKRLRKERRVKRFIAVVVGWAIIAWMIYLIIVTARTLPKIYDPYEILGVSRVSARLCPKKKDFLLTGLVLNRAPTRRPSLVTTRECL